MPCSILSFNAEEVLIEMQVSQPLGYAKIYSDSSGESHFANKEMFFSLVDFSPPAPPLSVSNPWSAGGVFVLSTPPGWYGNWHPAPSPLLLFGLRGEFEVEVSDGEVRRFAPGSVVLLEDTFGKGHRTRFVSDDRGFLVAVPLIEDRASRAK
jgi:hypothetical protein